MKEPLIPGGYILLSRNITESSIWEKPPLYLKVWVYLLSLAQHKQYKQLKRGQLRTSIPEIIEACSWRVGARIERPSKDQIYQILDWLRKPNEGGSESNTKATAITTTKATHGMLINIDNYCFYQDSRNYESNTESNDEKATKATRKQRQPNNINKNVKNDKNEQEDILNTSSPKRSKPVYDEDNSYMKMATYFLGKIKGWKHDYVFRGNLQTWADDFRKLSEIDTRSKQQIKELIDWVTSDPFWQINILSPKTLREKLNQLEAKMNGGGKRATSEGHLSGDTESNRKSITGGKTGRIGNYQPVSPIDLSDETII